MINVAHRERNDICSLFLVYSDNVVRDKIYSRIVDVPLLYGFSFTEFSSVSHRVLFKKNGAHSRDNLID